MNHVSIYNLCILHCIYTCNTYQQGNLNHIGVCIHQKQVLRSGLVEDSPLTWEIPICPSTACSMEVDISRDSCLIFFQMAMKRFKRHISLQLIPTSMQLRAKCHGNFLLPKCRSEPRIVVIKTAKAPESQVSKIQPSHISERYTVCQDLCQICVQQVELFDTPRASRKLTLPMCLRLKHGMC